MTEDFDVIRLSFRSYDFDAEFGLPEEPQVIQGVPSFTVGTMHITVSIRHVLDQIGREKLLQYLGLDWVPVDERLPMDRQRVLTYCPGGYVKSQIGVHTYYQDYSHSLGAWWMGEQNYPLDGNHVTHWAKLPERPGMK
jgi:hypothetical protein